MSGLFDDETPEQPRRGPSGGPQRSRALVATIIVLIVAFFLVSVFTAISTPNTKNSRTLVPSTLVNTSE